VAVIDPDGLFGGDRLRRCSNAAQLHWPRLFLASDGFARLEINYARIIGRAYPTFDPVPSETELQAWLLEYASHYLLFLYEIDGQVWGQWDTRSDLLPRYKTAADRRSPNPPEPDFTAWSRSYREQSKAFPKCFGNLSETFLHGVGVGVGVGKTICASPDGNARVGIPLSIDHPPFETTEADELFRVKPVRDTRRASELRSQQEIWFTKWWAEYWRHRAKKAAREAFSKQVKTEKRFQQVMAATRAQKAEMCAREEEKRPHGATWLNGERWQDEVETPTLAARESIYSKWEPPAVEATSG
jgi:hypothetical protein